MVFDWAMLCESVAWILMGIGALFMFVYVGIYSVKVDNEKKNISFERNEQLHLIREELCHIDNNLCRINLNFPNYFYGREINNGEE